MLSVWFLLLRRQLHTRPSLRASAGRSTGTAPLAGRLPPVGQDHPRPIPAGFIDPREGVWWLWVVLTI